MHKAKIIVFCIFLSWGLVFIAKFTSFPFSSDKAYSSEHNLRNYKYPRAPIMDRNGIVLAEGDGTNRRYPYGPITCHFLGFFHPKVGMSGIEGDYASKLVSNAQARTYYFVKNNSSKAPLKTTLDIRLQKIVYEAFGDREGGVVVLNARTGEKYVEVSKPTFDPNKKNYKELKKREDAPLLNRATKGLYYPGSTWKTVSSIILSKRQDKAIVCTGIYHIGNNTYKCMYKHGKVTLSSAYSQSCNLYFLKRCLSEVSQTEFIRTSQLFMRKKMPDSLNSKDYAFAILGQGPISVSPLEEALLAATISNEGRMPTPMSVIGEQAESSSVLSKEAALSLKKLMEGVVKNGTGRQLSDFLKKGSIGVKTGTAERLKNGKKVNVASMIGFAHRAKKDPVVFAVVIDNAENYSSQVCSPIVRKILEYYFAGKL